MTTMELAVENIGGIDAMDVSFEGGVTLVQGPNAANKTSLLRSVLFALGSSDAPLKSDAGEGRVRLTIGDRTVERTARRTDRGIQTAGEAWVTDPEDRLRVERFAGLLGDNPLRTAVVHDRDVETLLKEPMNIDALEEEREQKLQRKRELEASVAELEGVDERLDERERELEEKRERISDLESRLDDLTAERDELSDDDHLADLHERRADLRADEDDCLTRIEGLEDAIERLEERRDELDRAIEEAEAEAAGPGIEELERERADVRAELEDVENRLDVLQSVLTANREMLDSEFTGVLGYDAGLMEDELTCWACGRTAERGAFEGAVADLQELIEADKERLRNRRPELDELDDRIQAVRDARSRRQELQSERRDVEQRLEERRDSLSQQRARLEEVREDVRAVDEEIAERESEQADEASDVSEEIEATRVEMRTLQGEVERLADRCADLREKQRERRQHRQRIDELGEEVAALTDRIENLETELREVFNGATDDLLDVLDFERIERVWLDGNFEVVVARETDGSTRADTIEHLAESEREMVGLVLGLAGFVTYDVAEISPVLVLDSLGAFDADRTLRLIEYLSDHTDVLLAAVHPESAGAEGVQTVTFDRQATP